MQRLVLIAIAFVVGFGLWTGFASSQNDPWWRPLNPQGQSEGVTFGTVLPTTNLVPGEIAVDVDAGPAVYIRNTANTGWNALMSVLAGLGTDNTIPVFDGSGSIEDSTVTDDGTTVIATAGRLLLGSASGVANNIYLNAPSRRIEFEGTTADAYEGIIFGSDFLGATDVLLTLSNPAAGSSGNIVEISTAVPAMDAAGGDIINYLELDFTNANHTGGTLHGIHFDHFTGDAQASEYGVAFGQGWDYEFAHTNSEDIDFIVPLNNGYTFNDANTLQGTISDSGFLPVTYAHAALPASDNGNIIYCSDCDPSTNPCTTVGSQTGAIAVRQNGAWVCLP